MQTPSRRARRAAAGVRRPSQHLLRWPIAFTAALAAFLLLPRIQQHRTLFVSFAVTSAILAAWCLTLWLRGRRLRLEISLRPQHYLQAIAHLSIYVYWSLYWEPIRDAAALIAAQIVFAYAFDMLLSWSRRESFTLGFGPFPIIFSTNLFLRFRDDWFYLQFLMVAVGFLAKELIRWNKDGRRVHIFNPSSFPLALASLLLIVTHTTHITWGQELATTLFRPPHIYLFIFLVALPGQYLFGVSTMTLSAVATTCLFGAAYFAATGSYYFIDVTIPIAVFLGMHLLFTDPSTAPRTELGRIIYGVMYGATVVFLYWLLAKAGAPTFYDKLLQVPVMNLMVQAIDRAVRSRWLAWLDPARVGPSVAPIRRNAAYASLWVLTFAGMTYAGVIGDRHPGHSIPFWQQACGEGRRNACRALGRIEAKNCADGSGWACNELGRLMTAGALADNASPGDAFQRACALGFPTGCRNVNMSAAGRAPEYAPPRLEDYAFLLREGKGALPPATPGDTFDAACAKGWADGCSSLGALYRMGVAGLPEDKPRAASLLADACTRGSAAGCADLGLMHKLGDGVARDPAKALTLLGRACDLSMAQACVWLAEERAAR